MKKFLLILMIIAACFPIITNAQEENEDWQVALLHIKGNQVVFITPDGLSNETISVPEGLYDPDMGLILAFELSPDFRYLAYPELVNEAGKTPNAQILIADLVAGTCCTTVQMPFEDVDSISLGSFSPDSTQLVAAIGKVYTPEIQQALIIIDSATGNVITSVDPMALTDSNNIFFGNWSAEGIEVHPNCFACGGVWNGRFSLWNPETNELSPTEHFFSIAGDRLESTGEFVEAIQHPDYPFLQMESMLPPTNAIGYYAEGYPPDGLPPVIFPGTPYYEANQITPKPYWVADGSAIFLISMEQVPAHIVFRNGTSNIVESITMDMIFLAGTPDGWLIFDRRDNSVIHYVIAEDRSVSSETVAHFAGDVQVLQVPALGTDVEPDFAIVE